MALVAKLGETSLAKGTARSINASLPILPIILLKILLRTSSDIRIFIRSYFVTTETIGFHCFYILPFSVFLGILTSSFIPLYYFNILFTEMNSS